jgi:hypothetical protein
MTVILRGFVLKHGSFLFLVSDEDESDPRSVVDDNASQDCIPSCHGRTAT